MLSLAANQIVIRANHQAPAAGAAASVVCLRAGGRLRRLWCHRKALPASTAGEPHGEPRCVTSSGHDFIRAPFGFVAIHKRFDASRARPAFYTVTNQLILVASFYFLVYLIDRPGGVRASASGHDVRLGAAPRARRFRAAASHEAVATT